MHNQKGLVPIVVVSAIVIISLVVVGAAWWYEQEKEEEPTVNTQGTATNNNVNAPSNQNLANVVVVNGTTAENTNNTNATTVINENTNATAETGCPVWPTYTDPEYGWTMNYPCDWTYERVYEASGDEVLFDYPIRYTIFQSPTDHYRLLVGIMEDGGAGSTINRTGVGAGDWQDQAAIMVANTSVPVRELVYQNKVKEVFFYTAGPVTIGSYLLTATFDQDQDSIDYDDIDLTDTNELDLGRQILMSLELP
ncbi:MAG: hypothetical protein ACOYUK_05065 [Patescibacteria group bacterium]